MEKCHGQDTSRSYTHGTAYSNPTDLWLHLRQDLRSLSLWKKRPEVTLKSDERAEPMITWLITDYFSHRRLLWKSSRLWIFWKATTTWLYLLFRFAGTCLVVGGLFLCKLQVWRLCGCPLAENDTAFSQAWHKFWSCTLYSIPMITYTTTSQPHPGRNVNQ
jgi:hypothetical protein